MNPDKEVYYDKGYSICVFYYSKFTVKKVKKSIVFTDRKTRRESYKILINSTQKTDRAWVKLKSKKYIHYVKYENRKKYDVIFYNSSKFDTSYVSYLKDIHFIDLNDLATINGYYQNIKYPYGEFLHLTDTLSFLYKEKNIYNVVLNRNAGIKIDKTNWDIIYSKNDTIILNNLNDSTSVFVKRVPNIIKNGSFEEIDKCPEKLVFQKFANVPDVPEWLYGLKYWISPNSLPFEIKSNCSANKIFNAKNNIISINNTVYGNNYASLIYYIPNKFPQNYIEYNVSNLLQKDKKYILGLKYKRGNSSKFSAKNFYYAFSDTLIKRKLLYDTINNYFYNPIKLISCDSLPIINSDDWVDFRIVFTAGSKHNYLILGNLNPENTSNINFNFSKKSRSTDLIYFIDEVYIIEYTPDNIKLSGVQTDYLINCD